MVDINNAITPGYGGRLRDERERLGLSQEALAELVGVKRLAQSQYEREVTAPTVKYLSEAAKSGINLNYVLFGLVTGKASLSAQDQQRIEMRIFKLIEEYAMRSCGGKLSAEARYVLYDVLRNQFIGNDEQQEDIQDIDLSKILSKSS